MSLFSRCACITIAPAVSIVYAFHGFWISGVASEHHLRSGGAVFFSGMRFRSGVSSELGEVSTGLA